MLYYWPIKLSLVIFPPFFHGLAFDSVHFLCSFLLGFGGALDLGAVLDFVDSGHDLIIAADASASDLIKSIATESGVDFDEVSVEIYDSFHSFRRYQICYLVVYLFPIFLFSF